MTPLDAWVNTANIQRLHHQLLDPALAPQSALLAARLLEEEASQAARVARGCPRLPPPPENPPPRR